MKKLPDEAFLTEFNASGDRLIFSTYISSDAQNNPITNASALAIAPGGGIYLAGGSGPYGGSSSVYLMNGSERVAKHTGAIALATCLRSRTSLFCTEVVTYRYRKPRPDMRSPSDQRILAEAGVLTDSPSYRGLTRIKDETRPDGSLPRKACPMDERVCFWLESSVLGGVEARARNAPNMISRKIG